MDETSLEGLTEEELQKLMELGVIPEKQSGLDLQMKQAYDLRNQGAPQGTTGRGGVFVAASPLDHIGVGMQKYKADQEVKDLQAQQAELLRQTVEGRMGYGKKLLGGMGAPRGLGPVPSRMETF